MYPIGNNFKINSHKYIKLGFQNKQKQIIKFNFAFGYSNDGKFRYRGQRRSGTQS